MSSADSQQTIEAVPRLILASASPRRQELLRQAGYDFDLDPAHIDEDAHPAQLLPVDLARYLAQAKANEVARRHPLDYILAADTVVAFGDQSIGKADDSDDARRILQLLSGTTHIVITGVVLRRIASGYERVRSAMSAVRMRSLSRDEIDRYVATGLWRGKAGAYGIQDQDPFVTNMAGSLTNIVGLPMEITRQMLHEAGIEPHAVDSSR